MPRLSPELLLDLIPRDEEKVGPEPVQWTKRKLTAGGAFVIFMEEPNSTARLEPKIEMDMFSLPGVDKDSGAAVWDPRRKVILIYENHENLQEGSEEHERIYERTRRHSWTMFKQEADVIKRRVISDKPKLGQ